MRPALCIIVPVLNEAQSLPSFLAALQGFRLRGARLVVVDGGSDDDTLVTARAHADLAFLAPRGRAAPDERQHRGLPSRRLAVLACRYPAARTPTRWCAVPRSGHAAGAGLTYASTAIGPCFEPLQH